MKITLKNKVFIVFVNSFIFTIFFNLPIIIERYENYKVAGGNKALYLACVELLVTVFFVFPIIYFISKQKFIIFLTYILSGLSAYFVYSLKITISSEIIGAFFEASQKEFLEFLNLRLCLFILFSVIIAYVAIYLHKISIFDIDKDKRINFICGVFSIACIIGDGDWINNIMPYNLVKEAGIYIMDRTSINKKRFNIADNFKYELDSKSDNLNIVLIIGESAREDHFALSGYNRNTNPYLSKEGSNLIYFKNVTACFPLTRIAVPCMITRGERENYKAAKDETSFIGIFKNLGFYTAWFGMQGTYTVIDAPYIELAKEADKTLLIGTDVDMFSSNDLSLLPFVSQFFQNNKEGRNLLILHTYGSHFHYEERYTDEFREFKPICFKKKFLTDMSQCSIEERINSYDNSILFTDYFIKTIIDYLRDKNAILIYTSDHGESLGENGRFLHGTHNADEQVAVNQIFWLSDKFIELYPNYVKNLKSKQNNEILHDHLFHSILGCAGVKSEVVDNKLNLCKE